MFLIWLQGKNKSKILTKDISGECKCKFDGRIKSGVMINVRCLWMCRKHHLCGKYYIWNPATCGCKKGK